ncbi:MAG: hypothetical protein CMH47_16615 [Muricauda sp.]|nr:hypothetical protein [Allomuricauda sp.]
MVENMDPERSRRVYCAIVGFLVKGEGLMDYQIVRWLETRTLSGVEGCIVRLSDFWQMVKGE